MAFFNSLRRVVSNTVLLPVAIVKDVVTLGGSLNNSKSYTLDRGKKLLSSLADTEKSLEGFAEEPDHKRIE